MLHPATCNDGGPSRPDSGLVSRGRLPQPAPPVSPRVPEVRPVSGRGAEFQSPFPGLRQAADVGTRRGDRALASWFVSAFSHPHHVTENLHDPGLLLKTLRCP